MKIFNNGSKLYHIIIFLYSNAKFKYYFKFERYFFGFINYNYLKLLKVNCGNIGSYVGCYDCGLNCAFLASQIQNSNNMTNDICVLVCQSNSYAYSVTING